MSTNSDAVDQLAVAVNTIIANVRALGPVVECVDHLTQTGDGQLAARTCDDVMAALWPNGNPETVGRADWWSTPLGRLCARTADHDCPDAVTYAVAAAMLGLERGTVSTMVSRGNLDRHPDGGVLRSSVLTRLGRTT